MSIFRVFSFWMLIIWTLFGMPLAACRYMAQESSYRGINAPPPHQVGNNLEAQQGAG